MPAATAETESVDKIESLEEPKTSAPRDIAEGGTDKESQSPVGICEKPEVSGDVRKDEGVVAEDSEPKLESRDGDKAPEQAENTEGHAKVVKGCDVDDPQPKSELNVSQVEEKSSEAKDLKPEVVVN